MKNLKETKKRLLLLWGNPCQFVETIVPVIPKLAEKFFVSIITIDSYAPKSFFKILKDMKSINIIENYWIAPNDDNIIKHQLYIKSKVDEWRESSFDIIMTLSDMQPIERYIYECVLSTNCIRVCCQPFHITHLLRHTNLAKRLLGIENIATVSNVENKVFRVSPIVKFVNKIRAKESIFELLVSIYNYAKHRIKNFYYRMIKRHCDYFLSRIFLPKILVGKIFPLEKYDELTQVGSGKSDAYVFCVELQAKAFAKLFNKNITYLSAYLTQGNCRCKNMSNEKSAIFVPLSTTNAEDLALFYRDISTVMSNTGATAVHLRPHPRDNTRGYSIVQKYLKSKGVNAKIVDNDRPIREIICDYLAATGTISNALGDARADCENILVIGFKAGNKYFTDDPELLFGNCEGIGWINEDGTYDRKIFQKRKFHPLAQKNIVEILQDLANSRSMVLQK
jgi:hypothetical protein